MADPQKPLTRELKSARQLQRLRKNIDGYFGETIDIHSVLADCAAAAKAHGWTIEDIPVAQDLSLMGLVRLARDADLLSSRRAEVPRIYLSAGIHGDEPAGPLAARQLLQQNRWPESIELWFCPCLNPAGFLLNRRENRDGVDLNRQYLEATAPETRAHIGWLERQPRFDLCLCLHEDWESHGFYVYELNPDNRPSLAEPIVRSVMEVCPIDLSDSIEGRAAHNGIIRPSLDPRSRPQWPEAFFLITYKTGLSYTLEAPSDFPLAVRVAALVSGVESALQTFASGQIKLQK
ncbi:MAG TPA: M14 family metallocarboxypeptidase [Candidatus Limnocylindrales bacterium]|nr:M14 family metallocarboxypeptidase [Candidatus Limnocylindrales bacterium]